MKIYGRHLLALMVTCFLCALSRVNAAASATLFSYAQHNLVSDIPGLADQTDPQLVNPWGIAISAASPFWISDNHAGVSTLYDGTGAKQALVVTVPTPAGGTPPSAPTGIIFNSTTNFQVGGAASRFIFVGEDGVVSAWASGTNAVLMADNSASETIYKGLAQGGSGGSNYLYAADFHNGKVDVFDGEFKPATLAGSFSDTNIPPGFAPFNIANIAGQLYVTYAKQDDNKEDDVGGPGNGYVDIFDTSGNLVKRFISQGALNSPWGLTMAPSTFGPFGGTLLVGNFGDGKINAYDPATGAWLGQLNNSNGNAIAIDGLWALQFGNGGKGGAANTLYFTAGIAGGGSLEDHGLFGSISVVRPPNLFAQHNLVSDISGLADQTDSQLVNPWGIAISAASPFWISDNHAGVSTIYDGTGAKQSLVVTVPTPTGGTPPSAPTGVIFNTTTNFQVAGVASKFIFVGEDGVVSAWASGTNAVLMADNSASETIYKGLAQGSSAGSNYLYAADFHNGKIDVFDADFKPATLAGSFSDTNIPPGFAPFNIANIAGQLYVTFAKQDEDKEDDVGGPGNGYVDIFDTAGNLVKRFALQGALNSPWGLALAPSTFGPFGGALLVGNFGDGKINAYEPATGAWLGQLNNSSGNAIAIDGLWALQFGNGGKGGAADTLYFTAGIAGGGSLEDHGLFGSISVVTLPDLFTQHNLVSDIAGLADQTDPQLVNPWGIAISAASPFWISDNHAGVSTLYDGTGAKQALVVTVPTSAGGTPPSAPTGVIFNTTTNFQIAGVASKFIFVGEDGVVSAWASGTNAVLMVDNSASETIYKGLALGDSGGSNFLYAADFHNGKVDIFDGDFKAATLSGSFADTNIPPGFAPFNIANIAGQLYVTYAKQDDNKEDDVGGPGNGYVDIFDTSGHLVKRFASQGALNSPWGLTLAPSAFGPFASALLVGNFGDGKINAYDPASGAWLGQLNNSNGNALAIEGLWALQFGNGGKGGDTNKLYFTAGIAGGGSLEDHGLFGSISLFSGILITHFEASPSQLTISWVGSSGPFILQRKTNITDAAWSDVGPVSTNTAQIPIEGSTGFFRIQKQGSP